MDCRVYGGWYWICAGLQSIGRIGSGSEMDYVIRGTDTVLIVDCRVYGGLILDLCWTAEYTND